MTKHHKYSPSSLELLEACPKYEKQEYEDTSASDEGSMMHEVLETEDRRLLETVEQEEQINKCFSILHDLRLEMGKDHEVLKEARLRVLDLDGTMLTQGTTDLVLLSSDKKRGVVLDWKMGITPISPADRNLQLQCYVAGAFQEFNDLEEIIGIMVAPRQDFNSRHVYVRSDIPSILERIKATIARREDPFAVPTCDETACTFCGLRGRCPALLGTAVTAFRGMGVLPLPSEFEVGKVATPLDRAKVHVLAKILEQWATEVKRLNTAAVYEHGEDMPPGFSLRKRAGGYGINGDLISEVSKHIIEKYGVSPEDPGFIACFSLSASKLGNYLSELTGENKKDLMQILIEDLPEAVSERSEVVYLQKKSKKITDEQILLGEIPE